MTAGDAAAAPRHGGCFCGAVRYVTSGAPVNERVCHCRRCQRILGAPCNARSLFRDDAVDIRGEVTDVAVSPELDTGSCTRCGTTLFFRRRSAGTTAVSAATFDDPSLFRPTMHVFTAFKQPWLVLDDGLEQHEAGPPPPAG